MMKLALLAFSAVLLQDPAPKNDALELLQKVVTRVKDAKSVRVVTTAMLVGHPQGPRETTVELTLRGANEFRLVTKLDGHLIRLKCDGKNILNAGGRMVDPKTIKPEDAMKWMRSRAALAPTLAMDYLEPSILELGIPEIGKAAFDGEEKVGGVTARIVAYDLPYGRGRTIAHRAWVDPERLIVLKREAKMGPMTMQEAVSVMEYDVECGDEFSPESRIELSRALETMVVKSAQLFATCTGRLPGRLEDLDSKPADYAGFWPDGGFWIGGKRSTDVEWKSKLLKPEPLCLSAPTDRLAKLFSAQVRLQLLKFAADAYDAAYWKLPASPADLVTKPESIEVWPDGGFVADSAKLIDPWGKPIEFGVRKDSLAIRCGRASVGTVLESELTLDEILKLPEGSGPRLNEEGKRDLAAALASVGSSDLATRDKAYQAIVAMGPSVLRGIREKLIDERIARTIERLLEIERSLTGLRFPWRGFLRAPRAVTYTDGPGRPEMNEAGMKQNLSIVAKAQEEMRADDFDKDKAANYWVRDVAGLFAQKSDTLVPPWLNLAKADATPARGTYAALKDLVEPDPFYQAYLLASLKLYVDADGRRKPYDDGTGRHATKFGIVFYPEVYDVSGRLTFILSEEGGWSKDLQGGEIDTFPADPAVAGWRKVN